MGSFAVSVDQKVLVVALPFAQSDESATEHLDGIVRGIGANMSFLHNHRHQHQSLSAASTL